MTRVLMLAADDRVTALVNGVPGHQVAVVDGQSVDQLHGLKALHQLLVGPGEDAPDVVMIGEMAASEAVEIAEVLSVAHSRAQLVLLSEPEPHVVQRAMRAGVREFVSPAASEDDLKVLLHRVESAASRRLSVAAPDAEAEPEHHRVVVVAGAKGGVGRSMVATTLAASLAREAPLDTVLVDLDLHFPDVSSLLDLVPMYTLADAFSTSAALDSLILKTFLAVHRTNCYVLCGADSPTAVDRTTPGQIKALLRALSAQFRYVVVDTSAGLQPSTVGALEEATDLVLVSTMNRSSCSALRRQVAVLGDLDILPSSRHVVLNFADRRSGLGVRDVEASLGLPVDVVIGRSSEISSANNLGQPLGTRRRGAAAAGAVDSLASRIRKEEENDFTSKHRGVAIA